MLGLCCLLPMVDWGWGSRCSVLSRIMLLYMAASIGNVSVPVLKVSGTFSASLFIIRPILNVVSSDHISRIWLKQKHTWKRLIRVKPETGSHDEELVTKPWPFDLKSEGWVFCVCVCVYMCICVYVYM